MKQLGVDGDSWAHCLNSEDSGKNNGGGCEESELIEELAGIVAP